MRTYLPGMICTVIAAAVFSYASVSETRSQSSEPARSLTIAFIGDQGWSYGAWAVLKLIKAEGADLVLHQGDLDYRGDPTNWDDLVTWTLGADFPYFASVGNHDSHAWYGPNGYQEKLQSRLNRVTEAICSGDLGVRSACTYRGVFFILSGVGTIPRTMDDPDHVAYIRDQLARTDAKWRICSWHKNQRLMQVGSGKDSVGWEPYEACREGGAIVATGHEHSYSRTHLLDNFETQHIASISETLTIEKGKSVVFVSGLGGHSIRSMDQVGPWWAAVYSSDQGANFGALFCTFFVNGDPSRASCYFKDIDLNVTDRFELISNITNP
jgi:hypothetical protein